MSIHQFHVLLQAPQSGTPGFWPMQGKAPIPGGPVSSNGDLLFLIVSVGLLAASLFFLYQAVHFQRWMTKGEENAPDPGAGVTVSWVFVSCTILLWMFYQYVHVVRFFGGGYTLVDFYLDFPKELAPALLIASCFPGFISLFKFALIGSFFRSSSVKASETSRSLMGVIVGFIFAATSFAASIVKLIEFFRS